MSFIGNGRKSILDAVNKFISTAAKDGKGPLANQLYAVQKEKNYEQVLLKGLAPMMDAIVATWCAQDVSNQLMALSMEDEKKSEPCSIGREVDAVAHGNVIALSNTIIRGYLSMQQDCGFVGNRSSNVFSLGNGGRELFLVVGAGDGRVAFFNPSRNRFLAVAGEKLVPGPVITNFHDCPHGGETFEMNNENCSFSLFCPAESVYVEIDLSNRKIIPVCTSNGEKYPWNVIRFDS